MSHKFGDQRLASWLDENGYHPRSNKHGSASCMYLLDDLLYESSILSKHAEQGNVVYKEDHTVGSGMMRWNVDLVLGPPETEVQTTITDDRPILEGEPDEIWLAVDAKSVMTEHQKARRNRQRDINSFADVMHYHHERAVTGGVILVNLAEKFRSPLRDEGDITTHNHIERVVEEIVDMFRSIERSEGEINANVDGVACIVVKHTNMDDGNQTKLVTNPPAPQEGDIVHYRTFLNILLDTLEPRFLE